jgi:predicted metal-dependent phosphoesterase TrpH
LIRADLHIHTTYSSDSTIQPRILVERLTAHPFLKVAAVTDHDSVKGIAAIKKLASVYPDIMIIPGVEISTPQGDIILLGAEELPPKPLTVDNVVGFAKDQGALSIAAHPYREYGLGDLARDVKVDAIEVLNGASPQSANKLAQELAKAMGIPGVAGSDAHAPEDLYSVFTQIQASLDIDEILNAIKRGDVNVSQVHKSIHF